jgi:MoxR-like ATPase
MPDAFRSWLTQHLAALESGLLERGTAVRLLLLAALAREHVLLIGPPGTAKSELARRLHRAFDGVRYFERLLTRFSTPEELFGPLSLKALEDDRYERLIDGYLPTAGVAFLDEVFKANSAILNTLLTLLNEREFDNGAGRRHTPLVTLVGASNEVPDDDALQAFHDRFLVRVPIAPVSDAAFAALLQLRDGAAPAASPAPITPGAMEALLDAAGRASLGDEALSALAELRAECAKQQIAVSDRRWRRIVELLWLAPYVVCAQPQAVPVVQAWFDARVVRAVPQPLPWLGAAVAAFEQQLEIEASMPADDDAAGGASGKLALARAIGRTDLVGGSEASPGGTGLLRIRAATLEQRTRRHYSSVHIAARLAQLDEVLAAVDAAREPMADALAQLQARIAGRLWLPPDLVQRWTGAHRDTLALLDAMAARLTATRDGFAALPLDELSDEPAAPAVAWG